MERVNRGRISKLNPELGYGFVQCPMGEEVFFSPDTVLQGVVLEDLKVNDRVEVEVTETDRGAFAKTLLREAA
jgi:cold shock CspA family protein